MSLDSKDGKWRYRHGWEVILLSLITPLILLPNTFLPPTSQPVIVGGLFFFYLLHILYNRANTSPLSILVLFILLWLPVNVWVAIDRQRAWISAGYLLLGIAYYHTLLRWPLVRKQPTIFTGLLIGIGSGLALLGPRLVELQSGALDLYAPLGLPPTIHLSRLGEAINPNVLAGALLLIMPFPLMFMLTKGWTDRLGLHILVSIAFVFIVVVIGSTQSRGAYLAMALVIPLLLVMRWPRLIYGVPLIIAGAVGFILWVGPQKFVEMLTFSATTPGLDQRLEIWSRAWYALWDFAFTGIGIGMFNVVVPLLYPYFLIPSMETIPHAHNLYLQIGVDLGMPGLIAHLALWINLVSMLVPLLRQRTDILSWTMAAGAFGSLIAMLLHGLVDAVTWGNKLAFLPWWLYALITLLFLRYQKEEHNIPG